MGAKFVFLALCATAVSARHLLDANRYLVQPLQPDSDLIARQHANVLERRNIDYGSESYLSGPSEPYIYSSDVNQYIPERHSLRHHNKEDGEAIENIDSFNNIVYKDHKLRTNINPSESYTYTTDYVVVDDFSAYTNVKPQAIHSASADLMRENIGKTTSAEPDLNQYYRQGDAYGTDFSTAPKTNLNNAMNLNNPKTNVQINEFNMGNERKTEKPKIYISGPVKNPQNNLTRPSNSGRSNAAGKTDDILKQKEAEEEIGWVWGMEPTTTEKDDLDNRAAFSGDQCPTGKIKVNGICVETH